MNRLRLVVLMLTAGGAATWAQKPNTVTNKQIGFTIDLPPGFVRANDAEQVALALRDNQGLDCDIFAAGKVKLTVCRYLPESYQAHMRWKELFEMESRSSNAQAVSYSKFNEKWFVVSGSSETLFYERVIQTDDVVGAFTMTYEEADKPLVDPWLGKLGKSFRLIPRAEAPKPTGAAEMTHCKSNAECTSPSFPKCDRDVGCMECTEDSDCKRPVIPVCERGRFGIGRCTRRQ